MVMEYMDEGDLKKYLMRNRLDCDYSNTTFENTLPTQLCPEDLLGIAWQVAKGMDFLASNQVSRGCMIYFRISFFSNFSLD